MQNGFQRFRVIEKITCDNYKLLSCVSLTKRKYCFHLCMYQTTGYSTELVSGLFLCHATVSSTTRSCQ